MLSWFAPVLLAGAGVALLFVAASAIDRRFTAPLAPRWAIVTMQSAAWAGLVLMVAYTVLCLGVLSQAMPRGMTPSTMPATPIEAWRDARLAPVADVLPSDASELEGSVIYLYKFGCEDCEGAYRELSSALDASGVKVWDVPSDSADGKLVCEQRRIAEVPYLVAIAPDGSVLATSPLDADGNYDEEAVRTAIEKAAGDAA